MRLISKYLHRVTPLYTYVYPHRYLLLIAAFLMAIVAGINSSIPFLIRSVLDRIFVNREALWLLPLALTIVALFTLKGLAFYLEGLITGRIGQKIIYDVRRNLVTHILGLDLNFFQNHMSGDLLSRITFDTSLILNAVTRALAALFQHGTMIIALIGVTLYLHFQLALLALLALPVAFFPIYRFGELSRNYWRRGQEEMAGLHSLLTETFQGIRVIKGFQLEQTFLNRILVSLENLLRTFLRIVRIQAGSQPLMEWIGALGMAFVIFIGGRWVIEGEMSTGTFFAFLSSIFLLYDPVRKLNGTWQDIQQGISAAERISELLHQKPRLKASVGKGRRKTFTRTIQFREVGFRYSPYSPWVLKGIHLEIPKKRKLAIVGHSGEGKSTLVDLLMRFYDPEEGSISIDDVDLREWDPEELGRLIARVDQHPVLFSGTILENIWMGNLQASREKVLWAARIAQVETIAAHFSRGYETSVGELGSKLSSGERQRIAIARALVRGAPILILDEATSALDSEREQHFLAQLIQNLPEVTILFITHRFKIARVAEEIVVLQSGRIIESGEHHELLQRNGLYSRLYQLSEEIPSFD